MTKRQTQYRLANELCVTCNVGLERSDYFYAMICPLCGRKHSYLVILKYKGQFK
ncbi:hypothetical protein LCGC14_1232930 [marine sediment metagenome]|uniref:Viral late gene transcription factor 3 zinc ribbon domain-containing protein n=1 Tax=marine sediment metagenome TaxID=412755 RepID=A0A0F9LV78_9ZZZZ